MAIKETTYANVKTKAKFFTGGKPKDFTFTSDTGGGTVNGRLATTDKGYNLRTAYNLRTDSSFCAEGLRELAAMLNELADMAA